MASVRVLGLPVRAKNGETHIHTYLELLEDLAVVLKLGLLTWQHMRQVSLDVA